MLLQMMMYVSNVLSGDMKILKLGNEEIENI